MSQAFMSYQDWNFSKINKRRKLKRMLDDYERSMLNRLDVADVRLHEYAYKHRHWSVTRFV